ncbi:MAG: hypothetical protein ABR880_21420 [Candidatus Sulfotelmatobacter sp.]
MRPAFVLTLLLMFAVFGWYIDHNTTGPRIKTPSMPADVVSGIVAPQLHTVNIGKGALSVAAMHFTYYTLSVPPGGHDVKVQGNFTATGGVGNDIECFLLNEEQFTNWKNRHATPTFYNSGKVTVADIQASLPDGPGTYYLVFNNNFSLLTAKAVEFNGTMVYYQ